jgi:hypothetical protein
MALGRALQKPVRKRTKSQTHSEPADYRVVQSTITCVGHSCFDGTTEQIYWCPAEMVEHATARGVPAFIAPISKVVPN